MSEQWDFVPEWKLGANGQELVGEIEGHDGMAYSSLTLARAREVSTEIRAIGDRYEIEGPTILGWALQWMADDIDKQLAKTEPQEAPPA